MATSDRSMTTPSLTSVALELFKERSSQMGVSPQQLAITCFRDAQVFLDTAQQVLDAKLDPNEDDKNPLDIAFAPNLKRTHPINLMSRTWGNLKLVREALAALDANPKLEFYEPHSWGKPEVNQARALFPAVISRANQFAVAK